MANLSGLIADLEIAFKAGSNDSTIMATLIGNAIDKYSKTLKVKTGTLTSSGSGNLGVPVISVNQTGGVIE